MGVKPFTLVVVLAPLPSKLSLIALAPSSDWSVELPSLFVSLLCLVVSVVFTCLVALEHFAHQVLLSSFARLPSLSRFSHFYVLMCLVRFESFVPMTVKVP